MYKPKKVESKLLIYQKYTDVIDYGYNLLVKYSKIEKYALSTSIRNSMFETTIYEPKERKIKTLEYNDRVVQTWYKEELKVKYVVRYIDA